MIEVLETTKQAWMSDRRVNSITVTFPALNLTYTNEDIDPKSLQLTESLSSAESMEFVGCIASCLKVAIFDVASNVKDQYITVKVQAGNTEEIKLFHGYVDSVEIDSDSRFKKIVAYDALYQIGQMDVSYWYNRLTFPMTLKAFRDSLCAYIGLTQKTTTLPNDDIEIRRELDNKQEIPAIVLLKSITQLNGCCGIINREGIFEYRFVSNKAIGSEDFDYEFYERLKYEEFYCNPIQRVVIRGNEEDAGVSAGAGNNRYIIQDNVLTYGLANDVLREAAENILAYLNELTYYPMRSTQSGCPFVEVGDTVAYNVPSYGYGVGTFLILNRTLTGVQFCRDSFESRGVQNQSDYITDLQAQLSALQRTASEIKNLNEKTIDYLLPTSMDESSISDGSNNDVLTFDFYSNKDEEKTSFYSQVTFLARTTADDVNEVFGDYSMTVKFKLDGVEMETLLESGGDGNRILFLNYLLQNLTKGNHSFTVNFALSGGAISNMNFASAYLLAASVVEDGNYSEDYEVDVDEEFADYMTEMDQEIVGDYVELSAPTGGSGNGQNFSGNQFCEDWLSAWVRPFEYRQIYDAKVSADLWYPSTEDDTEWQSETPQTGFYAYDGGWTNNLIPVFLDNEIVTNNNKHINFWCANVGIFLNSRALYMYGAYVDRASFKCVQNYPRQGYAVFEIGLTTGTIYKNQYAKYHGLSATQFNGNAGSNNLANFILVYNVDAFKTYLEGLDAATCLSLINSYFALAECNIKKEKHQTAGTTDWSDNDDYHGE